MHGHPIRRLAYKAFGEEIVNTGTGDAPPYTYTGKALDASGLMYYGARYYDPALAHFITPDTVYDAGTQGLNRYSYALNNPIRYNDPTGHWSIFPQGFWNSLPGQRMSQEIHGTEQALMTIASDAAEQVIYGNYTDKGNIVGTTGMILAGGLGIDLPADIRDTYYDVTHWEWSWTHAGKTALDGIGVLPVIGAFKYLRYGDELVGSLKGAQKLQKRAEALNNTRRAWEAENGTTAVIRAQHLHTGKKHVFIATEGIKMPKEFRDRLHTNETFIEEMGHAEETIANNIGDEWILIEGGTSRNVCKGRCAPILEDHGLTLGGDHFPGQKDKTPYRMFWRE